MSCLSSLLLRRQHSTVAVVAAARSPTMAFLSSSAKKRHVPPTTPFLLQQQQQQQQSFHWALSGTTTGNGSKSKTNDNSIDDNQDEFEPTWTYVPYDPAKAQQNTRNNNNNNNRRSFSSWTVPTSIDIPEDQVEMSFARSSGAGGQNVNKVNTKVELKLQVQSANFIPAEVKQRLSENQANRINKDGYLIVTAQEYRTQAQNRKAANAKLQQYILEAWPRPKVRKQRKGISKAAKERNLEFKKRRSEKKKSRGRVDF